MLTVFFNAFTLLLFLKECALFKTFRQISQVMNQTTVQGENIKYANSSLWLQLYFKPSIYIGRLLIQLYVLNLKCLWSTFFLTRFLLLCVCVLKGATFGVEGGQSKGLHSSALLRSPLFPPPLRNSSCTVSKVQCVFSTLSSSFSHLHKHMIRCEQFSSLDPTPLVAIAMSYKLSVLTLHICSIKDNMPDLLFKIQSHFLNSGSLISHSSKQTQSSHFQLMTLHFLD